MRCTGTVTSAENGIATVEILRRSACEECHKSSEGCTVCSFLGNAKKTVVKVPNTESANVGDRAVLETEGSRVLLYAFLVFVLPIVTAAVAWLLSVYVFGISGGRVYLVSLLGFVIPFFVLFAVFGRRKPWDNGIRMVSVISAVKAVKEDENQASPD